ncbi:MAG: hypothetical protein NTW86_33155 [Candidatus Sumerlaeota bacterium]|nr:hypothetical protein [Candidatus Sumerlaeota bacterium]
MNVIEKPLYPVYSPDYEQRCAETLESRLASMPVYESWRPLDPGPARPILERYRALPFLTKADLRARFPHGYILPPRAYEDGMRRGEIEHVATSGTTDERVTLLWHQRWWNASECASWSLNAHAARAADGTQREAILTSPICVGKVSENGSLSMAERRLERFLFLNEKADPTQWPDDHLDRMIAEIDAFQPVTLEANPTFLARLSRHIAETGAEVHQPAVIILTYEFPSRLHYRQIRRVFRRPTASSYGSTETGYVFMECEAGRLHQNVESCHVDFQPFKPEHGGPWIGRILVTTFDNPWMALVRFSVGDLVRLSPDPCPCGRREGLTLAASEGRAKDVTLTTDGRAVTVNQVDKALSGLDGLFAYRVEQTGADSYHCRLVGETGAEAGLADAAVDILRNLFGAAAKVAVECVPSISPEPSGKHRLAFRREPVDVETLFVK